VLANGGFGLYPSCRGRLFFKEAKVSTSNDELKRHKATLAELEAIRETIKDTIPKSEPTVMTRAEWQKLSPQESTAFFTRGGAVRDETPEERAQAAEASREAIRATGKQVILRNDWDQLSPSARSAFVSSGGVISD